MIKVDFTYSEIFDEYNKAGWVALHKSNAYPSSKKTKKLLLSRARAWKQLEKKITLTLEKITGITFKEKKVTCFVVGRGVPLSEPLILPVFASGPDSRFVDSLSHELVHILLSQPNGEKVLRRVATQLRKQYKNEPWNVILHVVVDAVMAELYLTLFSRSRIKSDYAFISSVTDYKRAWEIVFELTQKKVLNWLK